MTRQQAIVHNIPSDTLADVLERVLDKGIVIAGDIKVNIADVELLTIRIRLLICSVEKAQELGINWWRHDSFYSGGHDSFYGARRGQEQETEVEALRRRVAEMEGQTTRGDATK